MVSGRTKGMTYRGKGRVVLLAAQREDGDGNPTEEYIFLRADEFGRLRTVDAGAVSTFLGLTDTPGSYAGQALLVPRVNAAEDALEFAAAGGHAAILPQVDDLGATTWVIPGWGFRTSADSVIVADVLYYIPIYVARSRTFTQIGIHVGAAGAGGTVARLGIYAAAVDGDDDLTPGTLTLDAGTVATDSTGLKSIAISETLAEGFHFLGISSDGIPSLFHPDSQDAVWAPVTGREATITNRRRVILSVVVADGAAALPSPATAPTTAENISKANAFIGE